MTFIYADDADDKNPFKSICLDLELKSKQKNLLSFMSKIV